MNTENNDASKLTLGIGHVMQKISDRMRWDMAKIYKELDVEFESRWYPVVFVLYTKGPKGVVEIANELNYAHPSVVNIVNELKRKKMIVSQTDPRDGRRSILTLTQSAIAMIKKVEPMWVQIAQVNNEISKACDNALQALEKIEASFLERSYYDRIMERKAKF